MGKKRINRSEIVIGAPLPWNVYDQSDELLLKQGITVESEDQIEKLIERGLFIESGSSVDGQANLAEAHKEAPSALRLINAANLRLNKLLHNTEGEPDVKGRILDIVSALEFAIKINEDVAIGSVMLNIQGRYSIRHSIDVAIMALIFSKSLNMSAALSKSLACAALTMNLSMLDVQDRLQKKQCPDEAEKAKIRNHPRESVAMLRAAGVDDETWLSFIMHHHENEDGSGYPDKISRSEIPIGSKILAILDRYAARVSSREYRKSQLPNAALRGILVDDKDLLLPELASKFIHYMGIYPVGTYVRLINGEIGIVISHGESSTTPIVCAVVSPKGENYISFHVRDSSRTIYRIERVIDEKTIAIHASMQRLWGDAAAA